MPTDPSTESKKATRESSIERHWPAFVAIAVLIVLILVGIGFQLGKHSEQQAELAAKEQIIKHTLDSLKAAYAVTEKSKDSVKTQIITQTNTIVHHEKEVVTQAAAIKALPFTLVGPDLKARLEAAQAKPWPLDTNPTK